MHRPWALVFASVAACAGPAATQVSTPFEVRAWVARERFQLDAWMLDRGDLLGAR